jgi:hypothetical protein
VDFDVLNENLIKKLISCIKYISRFLIKVQMYSLIHHLSTIMNQMELCDQYA